MSLSIGIVGLPNAGKSTLFNALVKAHQAKVADYPFTTIEPNVGIVEVPDERLDKIAETLQLPASPAGGPKKIPATLQFIDIAGLVKNAHQGEGLGNQFLSHIREVDAIIHILDGFSKASDSTEAREIVKTELELAEIKKPTIYVLNVAEKDLQNKKEMLDTILICAKTEAELVDLDEKEAKEYLSSFNLSESCLNRLIKESYQLLNLITFYTLKNPSTIQQVHGRPEQSRGTTRSGQGQIQAWSILKGTTAPEAAGKVHTDFQRGFIAAEMVKADDLISSGGWHQAREKGKLRTEGKEYVISDGDVMLFKFNV